MCGLMKEERGIVVAKGTSAVGGEKVRGLEQEFGGIVLGGKGSGAREDGEDRYQRSPGGLILGSYSRRTDA